MFQERFLKVFPGLMFLFCVLEIFELVLIINDMDKSAKLEVAIKNNLNVLEHITILLNEHLEGMQLGHDKRLRKLKSNSATTFNRFRV